MTIDGGDDDDDEEEEDARRFPASNRQTQ